MRISVTTQISSLILTSLFSISAYSAPRHCIQFGGMGLAEAIDKTHLVAALSGEMTGAHATITRQQKTKTGLVLDMEHHFISNKNGLLKTKDKAVLTTVLGKDKTYMLEIKYKVIEAKGIYAGYKGKFHSYGLIKLGKGQVILRYKGEICK